RERGDHRVADELVDGWGDDGELPAAAMPRTLRARVPADLLAAAVPPPPGPQRPAAEAAPRNAGEQTVRRTTRARGAANPSLERLPLGPVEDRLPVSLGYFVALVRPDTREARVAEDDADRVRGPSVLRALRRREPLIVPAAGDRGQ